MRVNKIIEITVIMCTCIDVLVQYMDCTLPLHYHTIKYLMEYCNTIVIL